MSNVYTVEVEVTITADNAQEAFEMVAYGLKHQRGVLDVNGVCEPYCISGEEE